MRMLFISQLFDPEYSIKGLDFLSKLREKNPDLSINVITTFPNYPTGKIFPGYKMRLWQTETINGINIIRVYSHISHSRSKISRAVTYASFMISAMIALCFQKKPDVVYAYHPQVTTGILASFYKMIRGVPFITDVQDLWPDALVATNSAKQGRLYSFLSGLCNYIYRRADQIVVLSQGYKKALIERNVPAEKISVIYNWCLEEYSDETALFDAEIEKFKHKFCYIGNLGAAQALTPVISAFSRFNGSEVCLIIIGTGVEEAALKEHLQSLGAKNIFFLGYIPSKEVKKFQNRADVLLAHLKNQRLFDITIPSKTQSYLYGKKPLLMAVGGETGQLIETVNAGVKAAPENESSVAEAITSLINQKDDWARMGKNGYDFYMENMSIKIGSAKIAEILQKMLYTRNEQKG
ncbi:Glycosyltransferase involved in cell wall bisynthesis [Collimonas sp. OK607]|uniref:glycosyltransferase family 4 protein n=1 Tax=Collimonas sp. OK607 TaxID=1798194 RepID=UPI0008E099B5|nr:glycosyltransferase family 4 protein [Collimonas sp. OK607]SFA80118.1 Glycosyltransferase involved in cell wall bisynthesis [Collimonas sp. OK607]